jgi:transposase
VSVNKFERWFHNRAVRLVVMEACATAHYWARTLRARGIAVRLLPAKYVRAYVKRNKTDAAYALALAGGGARLGHSMQPFRSPCREPLTGYVARARHTNTRR